MPAKLRPKPCSHQSVMLTIASATDLDVDLSSAGYLQAHDARSVDLQMP